MSYQHSSISCAIRCLQDKKKIIFYKYKITLPARLFYLLNNWTINCVHLIQWQLMKVNRNHQRRWPDVGMWSGNASAAETLDHWVDGLTSHTEAPLHTSQACLQYSQFHFRNWYYDNVNGNFHTALNTFMKYRYIKMKRINNWLWKWAQFNIPLITQQVNLETSLYRQLIALVVAQRVEHWTCNQQVVGSNHTQGKSCVTTLGKLFTPTCLCHQAV